MISRLLIANRGEIACRIMSTCRRLGVETVAVYSDADAAAPHSMLADRGVRLPGSTSTETYLDFDAIIAAAQRSGADAIHPGYGFGSENAGFAQAVLDAGLIWVGPPPSAIEAMGSKIEAKRRMRNAGVPVLPDSEANSIEEIGFPMLLKASAGGGGRGMRLVHSADEYDAAMTSAAAEATAAFGDGTIFAERYLGNGRHVEIQVIADTHGVVSTLFERECSIQRRHQKIIEEAPSPAVDQVLRNAMSTAAIAAAEAVSYVGAGTVEFLLDQEHRFWFLEMNTRLQVEHPVTELVSGIDLVELQLLVANGEPLPTLPNEPCGHAIEVRLTAEDPAAGYRPSIGRIHRFDVPRAQPGIFPANGIRLDSGVESGSEISPFYDSMIAKIIVHGGTRIDAIQRLSDTLRTTLIHGPTTNLDQLRSIIASDEFTSGNFDTSLLDRRSFAETTIDDTEAILATCAALQARDRRRETPLAGLPSRWRNVGHSDRRIHLSRRSGETVAVTYRIVDDEASTTPTWIEARIEDQSERAAATTTGTRAARARIDHWATDVVLLEIDGVRSKWEFTIVGDQATGGETTPLWAFGTGPDRTHVFEIAPLFDLRDSAEIRGSMTAPMPGVIRTVRVAVGDEVAEGTPLLSLEAMKMEHEVVAPAAGQVTEILVEVGQQVETGETLLRITEPGD